MPKPSLYLRMFLVAGGEHEDQAATLSSLANAYAEAGMPGDAVEMQRKAAGMVRRARGAGSLGYATLLVRLSQLLVGAGSVHEAEQQAQR